MVLKVVVRLGNLKIIMFVQIWTLSNNLLVRMGHTPPPTPHPQASVSRLFEEREWGVQIRTRGKTLWNSIGIYVLFGCVCRS